jgi:hypothetical protein
MLYAMIVVRKGVVLSKIVRILLYFAPFKLQKRKALPQNRVYFVCFSLTFSSKSAVFGQNDVAECSRM